MILYNISLTLNLSNALFVQIQVLPPGDKTYLADFAIFSSIVDQTLKSVHRNVKNLQLPYDSNTHVY